MLESSCLPHYLESCCEVLKESMMSPIFCRSTFEPSTDGGGRKCPKKPRSTPRTEKLASRLRDQAAMTALDKVSFGFQYSQLPLPPRSPLLLSNKPLLDGTILRPTWKNQILNWRVAASNGAQKYSHELKPMATELLNLPKHHADHHLLRAFLQA
jgi:hypothetical protein